MNLDRNMSSAEIKLNLINLILKSDFENWNKSKSKTDKYIKLLLLLGINLNEEIEKEVADIEIDNMKEFGSLNSPKFFIINEIQNVFDQHVQYCEFLHIYFIKNAQGISLLFRFNNASTNISDDVKFLSDDVVYVLSGQNLHMVTNEDAATYVVNYKDFYNAQQFDHSRFSYTQYITFETENIRNNFKGFPASTKLLAAAKNDPIDRRLRQNIILEIEKDRVNNPQTLLDIAFFNIGNMQP